ncbi:MAG: hypothetical protein H7840_16300 [Alphaproteobacteria bacterium]
MTLLRSILLVVLAVASLSVQAAEAPRTGEGLEVAVPPGWVRLDYKSSAETEELYLVPPDQNSPDWRDMVVFTEYKGMTGANPRQVLEGSLADAARGCPGLQAQPIQEGLVNGYPAAFLTVACPGEPRTGKGEVNLVKVVAGNRNLYLVQRTWRTPPFDRDRPPVSSASIDVWVKYLGHLKPCDAGDPKHPCVTGK